jgi:far upstream element-binding protein
MAFPRAGLRTVPQIDHSTPGDHKAVTVTGPTPESVASAVAQINELMRVDATPGMGEVTEAVPCPPGIVGRIIGRGGETIRGLQQASQAHIVVNQVRIY